MRWLLATILALASVLPAQADPIVYVVDRAVGAITIQGTLTTDGTLGRWDSYNHFIAFELEFRRGETQVTLTDADASMFYYSIGLVEAHGTGELTWNPWAQGLYFELGRGAGSSKTGWELSTYCLDYLPVVVCYEWATVEGARSTAEHSNLPYTIAVQVVPEPATSALLLSALIALGLRRRHPARAPLAVAAEVSGL